MEGGGEDAVGYVGDGAVCGCGMCSATWVSGPVRGGWPRGSRCLAAIHSAHLPVASLLLLPPAAVDWWSLGILIFELLYGTTPFRGARRDETFENIIKSPLKFPSKPAVSEECRDLIEKLLVKDVGARLGSRTGANEIKSHPWFKGINWALLRHQQPPYVPRRASKAAGGSSTGGAAFDNY